MKVFIVFFGILIINTGFLAYQGDMGRYVQCQTFLKAVAEECAAGAALYHDENAYSDGRFRFRYDEGRRLIEYLLVESEFRSPLPPGSTLAYEVHFQDDDLGYDTDSGEELVREKDAENPSVTVTLTAQTGDLFRLPFLAVTEITRAAKYELPQ